MVVTERDEPQAVIGSSLHRIAFPDYYAKHVQRGGMLEHAHEHPGCWLAIYGYRLIAADPDLKKVVAAARAELGDEGALLVRAPDRSG